MTDGAPRFSGRVLVLGGTGMLGHKMVQVLRERFPDTWCTIRRNPADPPWNRIPIYDPRRTIGGVDFADFHGLTALLRGLRPDVVVNCAGVIKQRSQAEEAITNITINALLPHRLAAIVGEWGGRLIHFSTDCVFSGSRGDYAEDDFADAYDLYGRTKYLGEVAYPHTLTLRTSIIGRELHHHASLLDWFLAQEGKTIRGFREALWSGVTTNHLAWLVGEIIERFPELSGLVQLSSGKISKFDLLHLLRDGYDLDVSIEPDDSFRCDRSLRGGRLEAAIGYRCPGLPALIRELVEDATPYDEWTELA